MSARRGVIARKAKPSRTKPTSNVEAMRQAYWAVAVISSVRSTASMTKLNKEARNLSRHVAGSKK